MRYHHAEKAAQKKLVTIIMVRTMHRYHRIKNFLFQDTILIAVSIVVAVTIVRTGVLASVLTSTRELEFVGSFIAGIFFTSVFTTAPAIVTLGEIARVNSIWFTALFGAFGAVVGDIIIFQFIRGQFSEHLLELLKYKGAGKRIRILFTRKSFRWFMIVAGGLVIASPLPDELGIGLLGLSKIRTTRLIPLSFIFNGLGILLIGIIARAL